MPHSITSDNSSDDALPEGPSGNIDGRHELESCSDWDKRFREARKAIRAERKQIEHEPLREFIYHYSLTVLPWLLSLAAIRIYPSVPTLICAFLIAGFVQNGLGLLMHEGSHHFFSRSRTLSDYLSDSLVCLPIFNTVQGYRSPHFDHHRLSGHEEDPYYKLYGIYTSKAQVFRLLLNDMFGVASVQKFIQQYLAACRTFKVTGQRHN